MAPSRGSRDRRTKAELIAAIQTLAQRLEGLETQLEQQPDWTGEAIWIDGPTPKRAAVEVPGSRWPWETVRVESGGREYSAWAFKIRFGRPLETASLYTMIWVEPNMPWRGGVRVLRPGDTEPLPPPPRPGAHVSRIIELDD